MQVTGPALEIAAVFRRVHAVTIPWSRQRRIERVIRLHFWFATTEVVVVKVLT